MNYDDMQSNPAGSLTVYLAGPVEDSDSPSEWRSLMEDGYGFVNFVNPMNLGWVKGSEESIQTTLDASDDEVRKCRMGYDMMMIENCKRGVMLADAVLINWKQGESSVGTHWEHCIAWESGTPVAVLVPDDVDPYDYLSTFMYYHADVIESSTEMAIHKLYRMARP